MDIVEIIKNKKGFIAALDQSGGSSMKTLSNYGFDTSSIKNDEDMFLCIHEMRKRIIKNSAFDDRIMAAIIFRDTMKRDIDGINTVKYLSNKGILTFLKIDVGLEDREDGVRMLREIPDLESVLEEAKSYGVTGTKMRSVIMEYNEYGIKKCIEEQFKLAKTIIAHGLIPIIEPEVDINSKDKKQIETYMRTEVAKQLYKMKASDYVIFKFSLPDIPNYYNELLRHKNVLRIVALSGGYDKILASQKLKENKKMTASFSRALIEGLNYNMSDEEFDRELEESIALIYDASVKKIK